jgi:NAD(P)-dependent dehydrogenase (short-subunit alcohol dehydrogenase family)
MTNTLIIGVDSAIGSAIYKLLPNSTCTSRRDGSDHIYLDVLTNPWPVFGQKFDQVYYCISTVSDPQTTMETNATKSVECLSHIAQWMADQGTVTVLTSIMGSLMKGFMMPANEASLYYRMSKAALNMGVMELAQQHKNINWQLVHPGFVNTKLTRNLSYIDQAVDPEYAAEKIVNLPKINGISYIELDATGTRMIV